MATIQPALIQCYANPIPFYNQDTTVSVLGQAPYKAYNPLTMLQQVQDWQYQGNPYLYKCLYTDQITLLFHSNITGLSSMTLHVCDSNQKEITAVTSALNLAPFYKGYQLIPGNNYTDPLTGATQPLASNMWSFQFNDMISQIPSGGIYYLRLDLKFGSPLVTQSYYSEPILLSDEFMPNPWGTRLFHYAYTANNSQKNVVVTGWYNDYATNTIPYSPVWNLRCEGYRSRLNVKSLLIGYLQQIYDPIQIKTQNKKYWTLHLGDGSLGIPEWMLNVVSEAITSDLWYFDGYPYSLNYGSSSSSLTDMWKIKGDEANPLLNAECLIQERWEQSQAIITPTPVPFGSGQYSPGYYDSNYYKTS